MQNKVYGYMRVSTRKQNLDRQLKELLKFGVDENNIKFDKASGKDFERESYQLLKNDLLRSGDTLVVKSLDRLGRNKSLIKQEMEHFKNNNIRLKVLDIPTTLMEIKEGQDWIMDMVNNLLIEVLGSIAEQERITMKERQSEGIQALRERNQGKGMGRPKAEYPGNWNEIYDQWKTKRISAVKAMQQLKLSKTTFYKLIKEYEKNKEVSIDGKTKKC